MMFVTSCRFYQPFGAKDTFTFTNKIVPTFTSTGGPRYSGGVMFLECSANDKTADNKGVLFSPKRLIFEAKCEKSLNNRWKISGIKMKLQKYKPQLANQRTKRTTCMHNNCRSKAQLLHLLVQKLLIKCRCN